MVVNAGDFFAMLSATARIFHDILIDVGGFQLSDSMPYTAPVVLQPNGQSFATSHEYRSMPVLSPVRLEDHQDFFGAGFSAGRHAQSIAIPILSPCLSNHLQFLCGYCVGLNASDPIQGFSLRRPGRKAHMYVVLEE